MYRDIFVGWEIVLFMLAHELHLFLQLVASDKYDHSRNPQDYCVVIWALILLLLASQQEIQIYRPMPENFLFKCTNGKQDLNTEILIALYTSK